MIKSDEDENKLQKILKRFKCRSDCKKTGFNCSPLVQFSNEKEEDRKVSLLTIHILIKKRKCVISKPKARTRALKKETDREMAIQDQE